MFARSIRTWNWRGYIKRGLQIAEDCRWMSLPNPSASVGPNAVAGELLRIFPQSR